MKRKKIDAGLRHNFACDEDDHAETPRQAYEDLAPVLHSLCQLKDKSNDSLRLYDPYYCNGAVKKHLAAVGYSQCRNENEDAYSKSKWKHFDVLITNPPYSGNHIELMCDRLLAMSQSRSFFLLLPNWVVKKPYWKAVIESRSPFYLVPNERYRFLPPKGFRETRVSGTQKKTSPWPTLWYCYGGKHHDQLRAWAARSLKANSAFRFARTKNALRDLRRKRKK